MALKGAYSYHASGSREIYRCRQIHRQEDKPYPLRGVFQLHQQLRKKPSTLMGETASNGQEQDLSLQETVSHKGEQLLYPFRKEAP